MSDSQPWNTSIDFAVLSDIGMRRSNNQDAATTIPADSETRFLRNGHLFIVADGMGAHAAGELASRMAVQQISQHYLQATASSPSNALLQAVQLANEEVYARGQSNPEFYNMGTTVSALALTIDGALVAHVGDSRVYRLRGDQFEQLTFDHSLAWEMQATGQVDPDSPLGKSIPKNVITRSLGPNAEVLVDIEGPTKILPGDRYLLCSDGLSGQVDDQEIGVLLRCLSPERTARVLVDLANLRGGPDNTTILVVAVTGELISANAQRMAPDSSFRPPPLPLLVAAGACLVASVILGLVKQWIPMAIGLGCTLGVVGYLLRVCFADQTKPSTPNVPPPTSKQRRGPYRSCRAKPDKALIARLGSTIDELRAAAKGNNWTIDWQAIDRLQQQSRQAQAANRPEDSVRFQAEAIMEMMQQLRKQEHSGIADSALE